jgi:hypothetical protein
MLVLLMGGIFFFNYAVEMGSGAIIYVASSMKMATGVQK